MSLLSTFDLAFDTISGRSRSLLAVSNDEILYQRPRELPRSLTLFTIGEYVLRSAAAVEQTFGGLTRRLWDDPFEWTLPEKLSTSESIIEYLDEVDKARREGIAFITDDESLTREIAAPSRIIPVAQLLIETVARSEHFLGRAYAVFQMVSGEKPPRV